MKVCDSCGRSFKGMNETEIFDHLDWCETFEEPSKKNKVSYKKVARKKERQKWADDEVVD